jgi:hypothetical protein
MTDKDSFMERARKNLFTALAAFQNGQMNCEDVKCKDCSFNSESRPAGDRCEIVNLELKISSLLKAMEKDGYTQRP